MKKALQLLTVFILLSSTSMIFGQLGDTTQYIMMTEKSYTVKFQLGNNAPSLKSLLVSMRQNIHHPLKNIVYGDNEISFTTLAEVDVKTLNSFLQGESVMVKQVLKNEEMTE